MNYLAIYNSLIESRRTTQSTTKTESHHITPRALGGDDSESNLIDLSPREHFVAHLLLARIHGGPMWAAAAFMSRGGTKSAKDHRCTSRQYEYLKAKDAEWKSGLYSGSGNPFHGKTHGDEALKKMRKPRINKAGLFGAFRPAWTGAVISSVLTYKPRAVDVDLTLMRFIDSRHEKNQQLKKMSRFYKSSESMKSVMMTKDISGDKNPNYGNGQAISGDRNPMWGKERAEETKRKIGDKAKRTLECPHCGKVSNIANAHRWHFDNCKSKQQRAFTTAAPI